MTDVIDADSLSSAIRSVTHDKRSEHPDTINALKRFNIAPEVSLGLFIRNVNWVASFFSRDLEVYPFYLYSLCVCVLHVVQIVSILTLSSIMISDSNQIDLNARATAVTAIWYLGNFDNLTRIGMMTLRENWSLPFLWLQLLFIVMAFQQQQQYNTRQVKRPMRLKISFRMSIMIFLATLGFMIPWQLSSFIILTQSLSFIAIEILSMISEQRAKFGYHALHR